MTSDLVKFIYTQNFWKRWNLDYISLKPYAPYILTYTQMSFGFIHSINIYRVSAWYLACTEQRNNTQFCTMHATAFCENAGPTDAVSVDSG